MAQRTCPRRCSSCPAEAVSPQEAVAQGWVGGRGRPWTCAGCLSSLRQREQEARIRRAEAHARLMAGPAGRMILMALNV